MSRNRIWIPLAILVVLAGFAVRFHSLADRTLSHPEMYVPRLPLPVGLSDPPPRFALFPLLRDVVATDTHPPGYYGLMWFVTRALGATAWTIRMPSAVFGAGTVGLLLWIGVLLERRWAGGIAAALLAFNGYHVFWSQAARMYAMACFLGVLSAALLIAAAKQPGKAMLEWAYAAVALAGLATHVFFWPILAIEMLWVVVNVWSEGRALPRLLGTQVLVATFGTPLLAIAAYQSGNPVAHTFDDVALLGGDFMKFGFLLPRVAGPIDAYPAEAGPAMMFGADPGAWGWYGILGLALVLLALAARAKSAVKVEIVERPVRWWLLAGCAAVALVGNASLLWAAQTVAPKAPGVMRLTWMVSAVPVVSAVLAWLLSMGWPWTQRWRLPRLPAVLGGGALGLLFALALGPAAMLAIVSVTLHPLLTVRGLELTAPFLLYVLGLGIAELGRKKLWLAGVVLAALVPLHAMSLQGYAARNLDPLDEQRFVAAWGPEIRPGDLIFYRVNWAYTPVLWYLRDTPGRIVAKDFAQVCRENPQARVWVVTLYEDPRREERIAPLRGYRQGKSVTVEHGRADLFEP